MLDFEWRYPDADFDWAGENEISAYYIEGWQYDQDPKPEASPNLYRQGKLKDSKSVLAWLNHEVCALMLDSSKLELTLLLIGPFPTTRTTIGRRMGYLYRRLPPSHFRQNPFPTGCRNHRPKDYQCFMRNLPPCL